MFLLIRYTRTCSYLLDYVKRHLCLGKKWLVMILLKELRLYANWCHSVLNIYASRFLAFVFRLSDAIWSICTIWTHEVFVIVILFWLISLYLLYIFFNFICTSKKDMKLWFATCSACTSNCKCIWSNVLQYCMDYQTLKELLCNNRLKVWLSSLPTCWVADGTTLLKKKYEKRHQSSKDESVQFWVAF